MRNRCFLISLILFYSSLAHGAGKFSGVVTSHVARSRGWEVLFSSGEAKSVYRDTRWAVKIEKVLCDGEELKPITRSARFTPDWIAINIDTAEFIYRSVAADVISADRYTEEGGYYEASIYRIPEDSIDVIIFYRIRYPEGRVSEVMQSRTYDINSWPLAGKLNDRDYVARPGAYDLIEHKAKNNEPMGQPKHGEGRPAK